MKTRTAAHSWVDPHTIDSLFFVFPCKINKLFKSQEYQLTKRCLEGRLEGFKVSSWFLKIMKLVEYRIAKKGHDFHHCCRWLHHHYSRGYRLYNICLSTCQLIFMCFFYFYFNNWYSFFQNALFSCLVNVDHVTNRCTCRPIVLYTPCQCEADRRGWRAVFLFC